MYTVEDLVAPKLEFKGSEYRKWEVACNTLRAAYGMRCGYGKDGKWFEEPNSDYITETGYHEDELIRAAAATGVQATEMDADDADDTYGWLYTIVVLRNAYRIATKAIYDNDYGLMEWGFPHFHVEYDESSGGWFSYYDDEDTMELIVSR